MLLGCNLVCHVGVLMLHLIKGGCNGIGAWGFNSVLNGAILLLFLNFYVKNMHLGSRKNVEKNGESTIVAQSSSDLKKIKGKDL